MAITSQSLPKPDPNPAKPTALTQQQEVPATDHIVAKPLRTPNFANLKPKNPEMALYWGNKGVGDKESPLRYNQLVAMGFQPAKPEDVVDQNGNPCPSALAKDGRVIYGDLILLKIPRADYLGALKYNEEKALNKVRRVPRDVGIASDKVSVFVPSSSKFESGGNMAE